MKRLRNNLLAAGAVVFIINTTHAQSDREQILQQSASFSAFMVAGDVEGMMSVYTRDARIFPTNRSILAGEDLREYWVPKEGDDYDVLAHRATSSEIKVLGDEAYDWGYYEGTSIRNDKESSWKGKYVIVWKKEDGIWKMYLDIWNRVPDQ